PQLQTLSLHDALPIYRSAQRVRECEEQDAVTHVIRLQKKVTEDTSDRILACRWFRSTGASTKRRIALPNCPRHGCERQSIFAHRSEEHTSELQSRGHL